MRKPSAAQYGLWHGATARAWFAGALSAARATARLHVHENPLAEALSSFHLSVTGWAWQ